MERNKALKKEDIIMDGICGVIAQLEQGKEETQHGKWKQVITRGMLGKRK